MRRIRWFGFTGRRKHKPAPYFRFVLAEMAFLEFGRALNKKSKAKETVSRLNLCCTWPNLFWHLLVGDGEPLPLVGKREDRPWQYHGTTRAVGQAEDPLCGGGHESGAAGIAGRASGDDGEDCPSRTRGRRSPREG